MGVYFSNNIKNDIIMYNNDIKEQPCASQPDEICVCWNSGVCKKVYLEEKIKEDDVENSLLSLLPSKYLKIKRKV